MMVAALSLPQLGAAQTLLERLVMPGELIEGHARLEEDCGNCHAPFEQASQDQLCLDCHKAVRADVSAGQGFHGRHPAVAKAECKHCHTDHKGRDAPTACIACHRDDDAHDGKLGEACADCHTTADWRAAASFDHQKTRFALTGAHLKVRCQACHLSEVYKDTPTACADCHRVQDVHDGRFGTRCETCHDTAKWTSIRFDHDRDTKYALTGAHRETAATPAIWATPMTTNSGSAASTAMARTTSITG